MNKKYISIICIGMLLCTMLVYALPFPILTGVTTVRSTVFGKNMHERNPAALIKCTVQNLDSLTITNIQAVDSAGAVLEEIKGLKKVSFKGNFYWYNSVESFQFNNNTTNIFIKMEEKDLMRTNRIRFIFQNGGSTSQQEINFAN